MSGKVTLFCDGASRGNPGPGSFGFVVLAGEKVLAEGRACLGVVTNNVAEYQALLHGLKKCAELKATEVTVKSDSQLLVRQMLGQYKVKAPQIKVLFEQARTLVRQFQKVHFVHVPREENSHADALANEALDLA
jgi:ribonuclease HI